MYGQFYSSAAFIAIFILLQLAPLHVVTARQKAEGVDVQITGDPIIKPQILRGQPTEIKAFGRNLTVQSVEISPAENISIVEFRETAADAEDRRQQKKGMKIWSIVVLADKAAQPGERSIILVTPQGRSKPQTIKLVSHIPRISDLKVLAAESYSAKVEFSISVSDDAGDADFDSTKGTGFPITASLICSGGGYFSSFSPTKVVKKNAKESVVYATVSQFNSSARGECLLKVSIQDNESNVSNSLSEKIQFK